MLFFLLEDILEDNCFLGNSLRPKSQKGGSRMVAGHNGLWGLQLSPRTPETEAGP